MFEKHFIKQLNRIGIDINKCLKEEAIEIINKKIGEEKQKLEEAKKKLIKIYQEEIKNKSD